jgi:hypothetical protein
MAPLYLIWCIWREQNARTFEDCEASVVELKNIMFKPLYTWIIVRIFLVFLNFWIFVLFLLNRKSLLYTSYVLGIHPFALLMKLILIKKKKKTIKR